MSTVPGFNRIVNLVLRSGGMLRVDDLNGDLFLMFDDDDADEVRVELDREEVPKLFEPLRDWYGAADSVLKVGGEVENEYGRAKVIAIAEGFAMCRRAHQEAFVVGLDSEGAPDPHWWIP